MCTFRDLSSFSWHTVGTIQRYQIPAFNQIHLENKTMQLAYAGMENIGFFKSRYKIAAVTFKKQHTHTTTLYIDTHR